LESKMPRIREIAVMSGVRTAIGDYGGALKDQAPADLATKVIAEAVRRAGVTPESVGACVLGNVIHTEARDMYISRYAAIQAGLSHASQAFTLNRLCGSGLQAIVSAAQQIMLGDVDTAVAGGVESMSRGGYLLPKARWGQYMGNGEIIDMMAGGLTDPFETVHMGITAENIAGQWLISREDQDELAVQSHRRAARAIDAGYFKEQILPIELKSRKGTTVFDTDEHVRPDASLEGMANLRTVFKVDGVVTAGNASGINDGAAAVVLMDRELAESKGLTPMGRLVAYALAGVDPKIMGIGPVPAINKVMEQTGLSVDQMDVIELNEAFAAQALACTRDLNLDPAKVNPNGSGIGLGHPVGATGTILTVKLLHELKRIDGRYGLVSMCIGGGQGIAAIFERG
jgi:acetyl-CoA C-acetyltransferase